MNIFVGNLTLTATAQDLRRLFEPYGMVEMIEVITDRETGHPCGCGFVEMLERHAARAAIAGLHGLDLGGRACTVNEAYWWVRDYEAR
jgi:RNA recognition motif-containing protein